MNEKLISKVMLKKQEKYSYNWTARVAVLPVASGQVLEKDMLERCGGKSASGLKGCLFVKLAEFLVVSATTTPQPL